METHNQNAHRGDRNMKIYSLQIELWRGGACLSWRADRNSVCANLEKTPSKTNNNFSFLYKGYGALKISIFGFWRDVNRRYRVEELHWKGISPISSPSSQWYRLGSMELHCSVSSGQSVMLHSCHMGKTAITGIDISMHGFSFKWWMLLGNRVIDEEHIISSK